MEFVGRADSQVVTSVICNRSHPFNFGMIAPGNHLDLDSLRAAPPARYRSVARQIGICRAVWAVVCGWMRYAALPPAFMRGVVRVAHTGTGGSPSSAYLSQKRAKKNSKHRKIILFDALLPEIRTPPVPALAQGHFNQGMIAPGNHWNFDSLRAAPPSQVRGARRLTTRVP